MTAWALLLALLVPVGLWAQAGATGAISGVVQDPQGAVIPGAQIKVINKATGATVREVESTGAGTFAAPLLPAGAYKLEITATGFARYEAETVIVRVTETTNVVATLKIGQVTETVTVTEAATAVQVSNPTTGQTIGSHTVGTLPLSTRNFLTLLSLSAGANAEIFDSGALGRGFVSMNVNGQRAANNNFQLEGVNANDVNLPIFDNVALPNPQAIQEFKTQTSLYDASQGRNGGGNIQVAIKSGGSDYHGDVYEFFRNDKLNANDWFLNRDGEPRAVLRQNQFGASFGGPVPVLKDFFAYGNYQGTRAASGTATGTFFSTRIPVLPANRSAANLQALFFPTGLPAGFTQLDPVAVAFLNLPASRCPGFNDGTFCIPSLAGTPGITTSATGARTVNRADIARSLPGTFRDDQFSVSMDKQLTPKDRATGRFFYAKFEQLQPFGTISSLPHPENFPNSNRFLKLGWTRTISSNTVNDFRFGINRFFFARVPTEPILLTDVGATRGNAAEFPAAYRIFIAGAGVPNFSLGTAVNDDRGGAFNTFVWGDDFSHQRGRHLVRAGVEITRYQLNRFNNFAARGNVTFANLAGRIGFENFLLGAVTATQGRAGFSTFYFRATDAAAYVQDDWKFSPRLTLNLGLRWEGTSVAHEKFNFLSNFRGLGDGTPGPIRAIHPAETAVVGTSGVSNCTLLNCFDKNNFAPRVGMAYDVFGNQKTVVRAGYGLYYQRTSNQPLLQTSGGLPFAEDFSAAAFSVSTTNPFPSIRPSSDFPLPTDRVVPALAAFRDANGADPRGILAANAALAGAPIFLTANGAPNSGFTFFPERSFRAPKAQQWNLTVQHEFLKGWVLELGYVGTHGSQLIGTGRPFNPGQLCTTARPCRIGPEIGANVMVAAGTPGVTRAADGTITITQSNAVNVDARVPVAFLGLANSRGFFQGQEGVSTYHSWQTTVSHQWANGLYFQAAHTWSKSLDNGSGSAFADELNGLLHFGDYLNQRSNRGVADFHRTHRLVFSYNYDIPFGKWAGISNQGWGKLLHGWSINGVTILQSGNPITIFDSSSTLQDTEGQNGLNKAFLPAGFGLSDIETPGNVQDRVDNFFNLTPFLVGATGTQCVNNQNALVACGSMTDTGFAPIGNVARNRFPGPFQQNWDMSFVKSTKVTERYTVDFRAEFFNIWNHPSFQPPGAGGPGAVNGNTGFVDVQSGESPIVATVNRPRIIQFALLFKF